MTVAAIASRTRTIAIVAPAASAGECRPGAEPCVGVGIQYDAGVDDGGNGAGGGTEGCAHPLV
jgi:uncharacterized membrane protein